MKKLVLFITVALLIISSFTAVCAFADNTDEEPTSGGDLTRLNVPKTTYSYDEPINISAIGTGLDWVGIYYPDDLYSLRWTYIDKKQDKGVGSGVEFDVKTAGFMGSNAPATLPVGEYIIRLQPNDSSNFNLTIAWVKIKIVPPTDAPIPEKPLSASYTLDNDSDGFASGTLTVKLKETEIAKNVVAFWGDENGKLEGYTSLPKIKVKKDEVSYTFAKKLLIPQGATKLLIYTSNFFDQLSDDCYVIDLPKNAASVDFGKPIVEFQVVSDTHVVNKDKHTHNTNYVNMLKDIVANSKDSMGLFVVGDMVDNGWESEYKKMVNLYNTVEGAPPYYLAIGNHDLWADTLKVQNKLFTKYATLPDGSHPTSTHYDFWLNGYHFVFLGNDNLVNLIDATLSAETLDWLDKTLKQDRDENRPTFLFMHQAIYNTVAGSLNGQGWDGIVDSSIMRFKIVLRKYPEVIMFNGHSHWEFNSEKTMYPRSNSLPTIFNTSAVSYLTTSYNQMSGERLEGSEGYYIKVYEDKVLVLGRDFEKGQWNASTQFYVDYDNGTGPKKNQVKLDTLGVGGQLESIIAPPNTKITLPTAPTAEGYTFLGWFTDKDCTKEFDPETVITTDITLYAKWEQNAQTPDAPTSTTPTADPTTPADTTKAPDEKQSSPIITYVIIAVAVLLIGGAMVVFFIKKKK